MLPESPSQLISTVIESRMKEDCGRKHSNFLLDSHEIIVGQVLSVRCAYTCHLKPTRKLFDKILYSNVPSNVSDNEGSSQRVRTT